MENKYYFTRIPIEIEVSDLITIHYFEFLRGYIHDGEQHNFHELFYLDAGTNDLIYGGKKYDLKQGDLFLYSPNVYHGGNGFIDTNVDVFIISFKCESEALKSIEGKILRPSKEVKQLLKRIASEAFDTFDLKNDNPDSPGLVWKSNAPFAGAELIKMYLQTALILLIREQTQKTISPENNNTNSESGVKLSERMILYMDNNIETGKKVSVNEMSGIFGYSVSYLERTFKSSVGIAILQYYNNQRIAEAKKHIKAEELSMAEIATRLCFESPLYFSRVFKRITGISPSEYKKSLQIK